MLSRKSSSAQNASESASLYERAGKNSHRGRLAPAASVRETAGARHFIADYDLHGIVGVRVYWTSPGDFAAVDRLLAPVRKMLTREPDIVIRFCTHAATGALSVAERERSVFDDRHFFLLAADGKKTCVPFDCIGGRCELSCESGISSIPIVVELIQLTAFAKGYLPLHASAFVHSGIGVVVAGWTKGGKTESLLGFTEEGAAYIGDEWVLLSGDGGQVFGTPGPLRLWPWHANQMPRLAEHLSLSRRAMWRLVDALDTVQQRLQLRGLRRLMPAVRREVLLFEVRPEQIIDTSLIPLKGRFDKLILAISDASNGIEVKPADAAEVAARITASVQRELAPFMDHYFAFKFAFPERANPMLDGLGEQHVHKLRHALRNKEVCTVSHPYPPDMLQLYAALEPWITQRSRSPG